MNLKKTFLLKSKKKICLKIDKDVEILIVEFLMKRVKDFRSDWQIT